MGNVCRKKSNVIAAANSSEYFSYANNRNQRRSSIVDLNSSNPKSRKSGASSQGGRTRATRRSRKVLDSEDESGSEADGFNFGRSYTDASSLSSESPIGPIYDDQMLISFYNIGRIIGTGSFATVRMARNTRTQKCVALKYYVISDIVKKKQVDHVMNARCLFEDLKHEFLVQVLGSYKDDRYLYFYTEIYNGGEFFVHMKKVYKFEAEDAKIYIAQVILALEFLHEKDIMYRNLVPENILLDRRGHCIRS